jgi:hypothetical protein
MNPYLEAAIFGGLAGVVAAIVRHLIRSWS